MSVLARATGFEGGGGGAGGRVTSTPAAAKVGLWIFMAVVTSLFSLLVSAYGVRLSYTDWRPLPEIPQLWLNTAFLVLSSVALQWAQLAARKGRMHEVKAGWLAGGLLAFAFLAGQLWVWQQLDALGYLLASNPANSFFYLITGLHGLHLAGGLVAWSRAGMRVWRGVDAHLSVGLCTRYWHFLLAVWVALFGLLFIGSPSLIQIICGRP